MNDFTKEDLEQLSGGLSYWINRNQPKSEDMIPLFEKIEFMINHYCEHKERVANSDEDGHLVVQCGRCDLVLWHEKD